MARLGYARVSTKKQNLDRQLEALSNTTKIFTDKVSGVAQRTQLEALLDYLREGDIVVVTELDRLGRNANDLTKIMAQIQQKGATLEVLNLPSMTGIEDETLRRLINTLTIELYKYQAEVDRNRIKERQEQGIRIAKRNGKYKGRKQKFNRNDPRLELAFQLYLEGNSDKVVEEKTGINRRTFRRYRERYNITRNKKE